MTNIRVVKHEIFIVSFGHDWVKTRPCGLGIFGPINVFGSVKSGHTNKNSKKVFDI